MKKTIILFAVLFSFLLVSCNAKYENVNEKFETIEDAENFFRKFENASFDSLTMYEDPRFIVKIYSLTHSNHQKNLCFITSVQDSVEAVVLQRFSGNNYSGKIKTLHYGYNNPLLKDETLSIICIFNNVKLELNGEEVFEYKSRSLKN